MRGPWFRERAGILERDVEREIRTHAVDTLDEVEIARVRESAIVEPCGVLVTNGIDHQRVAFPFANGVAVPGERRVGLLRHVQGNLPPVLVVFPQLVDGVVGLNQLEAHRVQRDARIAVRIGVFQRRIGGVGEVLVLAGRRPLGLEFRRGPRRQRKILDRRQFACFGVAERTYPRARDIRMRRRDWRGCGLGTAGRRRDQCGGRRERAHMADHACSSLPSAVTILMTTPIFAPRSPGWNVTVTTSPVFTERLDHPLFLMFGGEPSSSSSSVVVPPLVEMPSSTCGFVHTYSVTVALIVVSLLMS